MSTGTSKVKSKVKASLQGNINLDFLIKFFFVEDDELARRNVLRNLENNNYQDILAPESPNELSEKLQNDSFSHAILDFNLLDWLVEENSFIKVNGEECYHGTDIGSYLKNHRQLTEIALFSKNHDALVRSYENLPDKRGIILLPRKTKFLHKDIISYIKNSHKSEVVVKPLHKLTGELPIEIQSFYAKKLISSFKTGEYFWKAGNYIWLVGVNQDISSHYSEIAKSNKYTWENPEEKFLLNISKDGLELESIEDKSAKLKIDLKNALKTGPAYKSESLIHKYSVTQAICKKYLAGEAEISKVIRKLETLGVNAMFESQKILFKELSQADSIQATRKEEIYDLLKDFSSKDFPQILDIYKGRVDSIEDGIVYVKFESFSPENVVRVEKFSIEFLNNHHIFNEDARFEYTIYVTPKICGGSSYHIEPI